MLQVEAEVEESTKAEVRHLKARLVDADQEVCKLQDRMQEVLTKTEATNSDLAHAKVRRACPGLKLSPSSTTGVERSVLVMLNADPGF